MTPDRRPRASRPPRAAAERLRAAVRRWAGRIGVEPRRVQIQWMTRKWASCSTAGRVCFSRELLQEDSAFQDVVIVHELLHLRVRNHGRLFKSLMNAYLPGWEAVAGARVSRICRANDGSGSR